MSEPFTGADERIRPVEEPDPAWADTMAFSAWDPSSGLFVVVRAQVLPNRPGATAGVLAWGGGRPVYAYGHAVDEVPLADWDDLAVAALRVQELEPLASWEVNLDDGDNGLSLRWDGLGPVARLGGRAYVQAARVTGKVDLQGHRVERVDGVGDRHHSWGVASLAGVAERHVLGGFVGATGGSPLERAIHVTEERRDDGTTSTVGVVHEAGESLAVVGVERRPSEAGGVEIVALCDGGRRITVHATGHGTSLPAMAEGRPDLVVEQRLVRLRSDDGLDGYGRYEVTGAPPGA